MSKQLMLPISLAFMNYKKLGLQELHKVSRCWLFYSMHWCINFLMTKLCSMWLLAFHRTRCVSIWNYLHLKESNAANSYFNQVFKHVHVFYSKPSLLKTIIFTKNSTVSDNTSIRCFTANHHAYLWRSALRPLSLSEKGWQFEK